MKRFSLLLLSLFLFVPVIHARYDPQYVENNKFGIHIVDINDLQEIPDLLNTSGGDWGYVTLVIRENERDVGKWQEVFNKMRRMHLIPVVRLATTVEGNSWRKPTATDINEWVNFLSQLNWVIENRYVILFNEPNHAKEWGNTLDPEGYATVAYEFARALKGYSDDYFILPAAMDVSAANDGASMDAAEYYKRVFGHKPELLNIIDGWNSHSYPNPAFSGSPHNSGRGTLRTYQWELSLLRSLGLQRDIPVFITETGWAHSQGKETQYQLMDPGQIAGYVSLASRGAWTDSRIIAITPFLYSYQDIPFDHFSWKKLGGSGFYEQYYAYQAIPKTAGKPHQHVRFDVLQKLLPETLVSLSTYTLTGKLRNTGQSIFKNAYLILEMNGVENAWPTVYEKVTELEPGEEGEFRLHVTTPPEEKKYSAVLRLVGESMNKELENQEITIIPPPSLTINTPLGWRLVSSSINVRVLIYTIDDKLIHTFTGREIVDGKIYAEGLRDIVPGLAYRIVVLVPNYLPRQTISVIRKDNTEVTMKRFLPFDYDNDGTWTTRDIWEILKKGPNHMIMLLLG